MLTQSAWPEFACFKSRSMDHKLVSIKVESSSSLESSNIWSMTKFSLGIAANYIPVVSLLQILLLLFFTTKEHNWFCEHTLMKMKWWRAREKITPRVDEICFLRVFENDLCRVFIVKHDFKSTPPLCHHFSSGHFVVAKIRLQLWVLLDNVCHSLDLVAHIFSNQENLKLFLIEVQVFSFLNELRIDNASLYAAS